ncbi:MAG TPA: hypothetical protein DCS82_04770 [Rhodospirillaceae bacterium]|nr:hypothetical protein [Rhodospirillaceae bacterium]HAA93541.1 hypothetical protein [Rhodospirillaceae bacterium]HAT35008.1 hypothetical protein [Rhodospirillaceae bacterium]
MWVPFELGRPFGAPGDAAFQNKVLRALLALFERQDGPVILEDFDEDPPGGHSYDQSGWSCPVSFPKPKGETESEILREILEEIGQLAPWYNLAIDERGRSTFGVAKLSIEEAVRFMARFLDGTPENPRDDITLGETLRFVCEDIKMWYFEAATAKPGTTNSRAVADWFWGETAAGNLFLAVYQKCVGHEDKGVRHVANSQFIPRAQEHRLT